MDEKTGPAEPCADCGHPAAKHLDGICLAENQWGDGVCACCEFTTEPTEELYD